MANAILLNQSTELTKQNILGQLDTSLVTDIKIDESVSSTNNGINSKLQLKYDTINKEDPSETKSKDLDLTTYITHFFKDAVFISTSSDTTYEAVN